MEELQMDLDFDSKRKQDRIPVEKVRKVQVKVMLNHEEVLFLDGARASSRLSRAEAMRALAFNRKIERAPVVPEVNLNLARELGRALGNLATVATVMRAGKFVELEDVKYQLTELQKALRGAK